MMTMTKTNKERGLSAPINMREFRGFTQTIIEAIQKVPKDHPGGRLGLYMIANRISALDMADTLGVSPMTVYSLVTGVRRPRTALLAKIEAILRQ